MRNLTKLSIQCVSTHSRPKAAGIFANSLKSMVTFQHTAARRRLDSFVKLRIAKVKFQHTAARRRLAFLQSNAYLPCLFQHTAARRRLENDRRYFVVWPEFQHTAARRRLAYFTAWSISSSGFNTQPPEGGWHCRAVNSDMAWLFQHTAARRRLEPLSKALLHQVLQPQFR